LRRLVPSSPGGESASLGASPRRWSRPISARRRTAGLSGRISRGVAEKIGAVLWFSDLRVYTKITDTAPPEQIIPLLNDYAER